MSLYSNSTQTHRGKNTAMTHPALSIGEFQRRFRVGRKRAWLKIPICKTTGDYERDLAAKRFGDIGALLM